MDQVTLELGKLGLQLIGTATVAWLAVRWAVAKFKKEKTWEQKLQIYTRILAAFREMQFVNDQWKAEIWKNFDREPAESEELLRRYREAKRDLDHCIAISTLVLPDATHRTLTALRDEIDNFRDEDAFLTYDGVGALISRAQAEITEQGRNELR